MFGVIVMKKCFLNLVCNESEVWGILKFIIFCILYYFNVKLIIYFCLVCDVRIFFKFF